MIAFLLSFVAGCFMAPMHTLQFHFGNSVFSTLKNLQFWIPSISWKNKYSDVEKLLRKKWFGFVPVPVALTDGWHLMQFFMLTALFAAIGSALYFGAVVNWWADALILRTLFGFGFYVNYNYFLKK